MSTLAVSTQGKFSARQELREELLKAGAYVNRRLEDVRDVGRPLNISNMLILLYFVYLYIFYYMFSFFHFFHIIYIYIRIILKNS
jgi:hypothetical protein